MSRSGNLVDRLFGLVIGLLVAAVLVSTGLGILLALLRAAAAELGAGMFRGAGFGISVLALLFVIGLLVRLASALRGFGDDVVRKSKGGDGTKANPQPRGAEHLIDDQDSHSARPRSRRRLRGHRP